MKLPVVLLFTVTLFACNQEPRQEKAITVTQPAEQEHTAFFPVTEFLLGQIADIRNKGVNPVKTTIINGKTDSGWVKTDRMKDEFSPFLSPLIDSTNLKGLFTEKRFLDQTLNAFTFTYDPIKALPDTFSLQRWDVYIDPQSNQVTRIYMVKKDSLHNTLLLTWQAGRSCKVVTISRDGQGKDHIEKEVTIKWDF